MVLQLNAITFGLMLVVAAGTLVYTLWNNSRQHENPYNSNQRRHFGTADIDESQRRRKSKSYLCSICLATMERYLTTLACNHVFHTRCIDTWFMTTNTCPNCRKPHAI